MRMSEEVSIFLNFNQTLRQLGHYFLGKVFICGVDKNNSV